jgi:hypothetical protein
VACKPVPAICTQTHFNPKAALPQFVRDPIGHCSICYVEESVNGAGSVHIRPFFSQLCNRWFILLLVVTSLSPLA